MTGAKPNIEHIIRRVEDAMASPQHNRRAVMQLICAAAALGIVSCSKRASITSGSLRFDGWGGSVQEALHRSVLLPYSERTGVKVVEGTFNDELTILNQVRTSQPGDFNVIQSAGVISYKRYIELGFGSVIDEANVPNLQLIMSPMMQGLREVTPHALSAIPYSYGTTGIAYNALYFSENDIRRDGAQILLDRQLKGKIGALNDMQTRVWYAALQSQQDPNAITDMDVIWNKTRESRDLVLKYWSSGAELMDLLGKEEILITDAYSGRVAFMQKQGFPIGYYNPPNTMAWIDNIFVLKGSPMAECEALLNFMLEPSVSIAVAEAEMYAPSLDPLRVSMPDSVQNLPTFDPTGHLEGLLQPAPAYWSSNYERWERRWHHVMKGA